MLHFGPSSIFVESLLKTCFGQSADKLLLKTCHRASLQQLYSDEMCVTLVMLSCVLSDCNDGTSFSVRHSVTWWRLGVWRWSESHHAVQTTTEGLPCWCAVISQSINKYTIMFIKSHVSQWSDSSEVLRYDIRHHRRVVNSGL